jgi:hypothetical protein
MGGFSMENNSVSKRKLLELIKKIEEITDTDEYSMEFFPGASNEEIAQFESDNDFTFPELFKEWLRFADGCCMFNVIQLYGVSHNPLVEPRPDGVEGNYICVGALCFGDAICFSDNSPKIIRYGETLIEYSDFNEFLEYVIELGVMDE